MWESERIGVQNVFLFWIYFLHWDVVWPDIFWSSSLIALKSVVSLSEQYLFGIKFCGNA